MKSKVYTLDDGSKVTAPGVAKDTGLSITTIRCRLCRTNEKKKVYANAKDPINRSNYKTYMLDDGSEWTVPEIAEKTGVSRSCAGARVLRTRDPKRVLAMPSDPDRISTKVLSAAAKERMCFGDREHWLLLARFT
jgi:hypothetical protein